MGQYCRRHLACSRLQLRVRPSPRRRDQQPLKLAMGLLTQVCFPSLFPSIGHIVGLTLIVHGSAPTGAFATALLAFLLPSNFPHQGRGVNQPSMRDKFSGAAIARLDFVGAAVLLAASILLVFGFEEAGSRYPWNSPIVISTIVCGGSLFLAFIACEYVVGKPKYPQEPVFPLRLLKDRHFVGLFL